MNELPAPPPPSGSFSEVTSRSCPTCGSIGIPRWRYPNGRWTDVPSYGGSGVAERCPDTWHMKRGAALPEDTCPDCGSRGRPERVPETGEAWCRNAWHQMSWRALAERVAVSEVAQELLMMAARMQLHRMPFERQCLAKYERAGGRQHGDRLVFCQLGEHQGSVHLELDTEFAWEVRSDFPGRLLEHVQNQRARHVFDLHNRCVCGYPPQDARDWYDHCTRAELRAVADWIEQRTSHTLNGEPGVLASTWAAELIREELKK